MSILVLRCMCFISFYSFQHQQKKMVIICSLCPQGTGQGSFDWILGKNSNHEVDYVLEQIT